MTDKLKAIIVCDFDGTITLQDVCDKILEVFGGDEWRATDMAFDTGKISFEKMNKIFAKNLRCTPAELDHLINSNIKLREGFHEFRSFLQEQGIGFLVVSAGWDLYIKSILKGASLTFVDDLPRIDVALSGQAIAVACNKLESHEGSFNFMMHPIKSDLGAPDKELIVKHLKSKFDVPVICIGDGVSDYSMAKAADFVFATGYLEEYCTKESIPFYSFSNFKDISSQITRIIKASKDSPLEANPDKKISGSMIKKLPLPATSLNEIEQCLAFIAPYSETPQAVVAMGSSTRRELWKEGSSDIDLNIFIENGSIEHLQEIVEELKAIDSPEFSWDVPPHIIQDIQQARIEGVLSTKRGQKFDLTWSGNEVVVGTTPWTVARDNLELYIGNLYVHSALLDGKLPVCKPIDHIEPYYPEPLRENRLRMLREELSDSADQAIRLLDQGDSGSAMVTLAHMQKVFLQALFISKRVYPLSYDKHINMQLTKFLGMSDKVTHELMAWRNISPSSVRDHRERWLKEITSDVVQNKKEPSRLKKSIRAIFNCLHFRSNKGDQPKTQSVDKNKKGPKPNSGE